MGRHAWALRLAAALALLACCAAGAHPAGAGRAPGSARAGAAAGGRGARRALLQAPVPLLGRHQLNGPARAPAPALAPAPAPASECAQWMHVTYQLFGPGIEPFTEGLREIFVEQLNCTLVEVDFEDIEILSVEEFLPLVGPSSETLARLAGHAAKQHAGRGGAGGEAAAAPGPGAPPLGASVVSSSLSSIGGRRLRQAGVGPQPAPVGSQVTPASASEPHVQMALRISTDSHESAHVTQELVAGAAPNGELLLRLQGQGMAVSSLRLAAHQLYDCGNVADPHCLTTVEQVRAGVQPAAPAASPGAPGGGAPAQSRVRAVLTGSDGAAPATPHELSATAAGLVAGVSMLAVLVAVVALLVVRRRRALAAGAADGSPRWSPRAGLSAKVSDASEPPGYAGAPSSADGRSAAHSLASTSSLADAGGREACGLGPRTGSAQSFSAARRGLADPLWPLPSGGRLSTPFAGIGRAGSGAGAEGGGAERHGALALRLAEAGGGSPGSSGRSGGGPAAAQAAGPPAGEAWSFGGANGGELIAFSDLQFSRLIGQGSFGRVFLGKWRETTVAIKLLNEPGMLHPEPWDAPNAPASLASAHRGGADPALLEGLTREAGLMAALRHPNVVLFLGACPDPPCMVTAFCARGSLLDVLARARASPAAAADLGWGRRLALALEAAKGMLYLHSRAPPVLHRDLKSANLLVDKDWHARLCDFNLSRVMDSALGGWLAPEVLAGRSYDCSCDVYSFGVILWELLTWQVPWEDYEGPWQVVIAVVDRGLRPEVPAPSALPSPPLRQHAAYVALMRRCWASDSAQRPGFDAIISDLRAIVDAEAQAQEHARRSSGCAR